MTMLKSFTDLKSVVKDYQIYGNPEGEIQEYHQDKYSPVQNLLYREALFGLDVYTKKELLNMSNSEKRRIKNVNFKAQKVLNEWKQEILIKKTNQLFSIFTNSPIASYIITSTSKPHSKFRCRLTFKELGVTKDEVIRKLISEKVFPDNFLSLTKPLKLCTSNV